MLRMNSGKILPALCISAALHGPAQGQATLVIPQSNITDGTTFVTEAATTDFDVAVAINLPGRIRTYASSNVLSAVSGGAGSIPVSSIFMKLISLGSANLSANSPSINLSTQNQDLYNGNFYHNDGAVVIRYTIPVDKYAWQAGTYQTNLRFSYTGLTVPTIRDNKALTITVPSFITAMGLWAAPDAALHINSLDHFRNADGASAAISLGDVISTVPFDISVKTGSPSFTYDPSAGNVNQERTVPSDAVSVSANTAPAIPLQYSRTGLNIFSQPLIPTGNRTAMQLNYSATAAALKSNFMYAGNYSLPISYRLRAYFQNNSVFITNSQGTLLRITVDDMAELLVNDPEVNLEFNNAADYVNGKSVEMPSHLTLSKTTPYEVYVRASAPDLSSGTATIPVSVISIGPAGNQAGVQTVPLSVEPARIISGTNPEIDRNIGIKYSISPTAAKTLAGKAPGTYTVKLVYSFVAN